jgi:phage shock protein C
MHNRYRHPYSDVPRNRLYRDSENSVIFGVCAGLADYFGFDVKITRICVAVGGLFFFPTVPIAYLILGLLLKDSPYPSRQRQVEEEALRRRVRAEPHSTLASVRHRYRDLERRLQRLEKYVTSKKFRLQREFDGLRD